MELLSRRTLNIPFCPVRLQLGYPVTDSWIFELLLFQHCMHGWCLCVYHLSCMFIVIVTYYNAWKQRLRHFLCFSQFILCFALFLFLEWRCLWACFTPDIGLLYPILSRQLWKYKCLDKAVLTIDSFSHRESPSALLFSWSRKSVWGERLDLALWDSQPPRVCCWINHWKKWGKFSCKMCPILSQQVPAASWIGTGGRDSTQSTASV